MQNHGHTYTGTGIDVQYHLYQIIWTEFKPTINMVNSVLSSYSWFIQVQTTPYKSIPNMLKVFHRYFILPTISFRRIPTKSLVNIAQGKHLNHPDYPFPNSTLLDVFILRFHFHLMEFHGQMMAKWMTIFHSSEGVKSPVHTQFSPARICKRNVFQVHMQKVHVHDIPLQFGIASPVHHWLFQNLINEKPVRGQVAAHIQSLHNLCVRLFSFIRITKIWLINDSRHLRK